jgi:hypothetical protein
MSWMEKGACFRKVPASRVFPSSGVAALSRSIRRGPPGDPGFYAWTVEELR